MSERYEDASEHDPAVSAIYRKAGDLAPPTCLDDAILTAARRASVRRRQRWILPMSTAAVVMLSVTLLMNMSDEWDFNGERTDNSPASQPLPAASRPEPGMAEKREFSLPAAPRELAVEEESHRVKPAEVMAEAIAPAAAPSPVETKARKAAPSSRRLATDTAILSKGAPAPSGQQTEQAARSKAESTGVLAFSNDFSSLEDSAKEAGKSEADAANPSPESGEKVLNQPGDLDMAGAERDEHNVLEPKPWLEKIRKLVKEEKMEAARKELEAFKKRYPDYTLPDDLKPLKIKEDTYSIH